MLHVSDQRVEARFFLLQSLTFSDEQGSRLRQLIVVSGTSAKPYQKRMLASWRMSQAVKRHAMYGMKEGSVAQSLYRYRGRADRFRTWRPFAESNRSPAPPYHRLDVAGI